MPKTMMRARPVSRLSAVPLATVRLARIIVFGIVVGQTALADAYDIANNAPNVVYELLLGGILTATLVPLFTRHLQSG
ncbi:MAG: lipid II flippase MurJ, partial [Acidimicrobiaceae bacterium]